MKKISIIIPIYNDEKYLEQCLSSVINQTIGLENIEVILIDDASKDKSYEIAQQYKVKYPDNFIIKRLEHNSGSGGRPRNVGIKYATGKYLMFSDADDFFDIRAFEAMYNAIESKKADFIISNWSYTNEKGVPFSNPVFDEKRFDNFKLDIKDYKDSFWIMNSSMCNKIFNREFIEKNNIRCLEGVYGEDTYFSDKAFLNSTAVYYIKDITYFYRQRNSTYKEVSSSYNCSKDFFDGMNVSYKKIYNLFVEYNEIEFYRFLYARNMSYLLYRFIDSEQLNYDEKVQILKDLKWFFKLSKTLKVPTCPKSLSFLIDLILKDEMEQSIAIFDIIYELRKFIDAETRKKISKPSEEIYSEILNTKLDNVKEIKMEE